MTSAHRGAQGAPATLQQAQGRPEQGRGATSGAGQGAPASEEPGFGAEPRLLLDALERYWGYSAFRPLQREAMQAILDGRDSVVVLPTGGGKSLCFQAPALVRPGLALVVSPLISLMKDQVDSLTANGVPAACFNSSLPADERASVLQGIREGRYRLL